MVMVKSECAIYFSKKLNSYCGCPEGFVFWKWRCFRSAYHFHDPCIVSAQCQEGQVCHPLSNVCSCPYGISNCTKTMTSTENPIKVTRYDDFFGFSSGCKHWWWKMMFATICNPVIPHLTWFLIMVFIAWPEAKCL